MAWAIDLSVSLAYQLSNSMVPQCLLVVQLFSALRVLIIETKLHFSKLFCLINRTLRDSTFKLLLDIQTSTLLHVSVLKQFLFLKEIQWTSTFILILVLFHSKNGCMNINFDFWLVSIIPLIGDFPDTSDKTLLFHSPDHCRSWFHVVGLHYSIHV